MEINGLQEEWQSGFRKGRSTLDNIVRLESDILEAFEKKEKILAVFIDIKNDFDCVWRRLIIQSPLNDGIDGYILHFVNNLLARCTFRIRICSTLSDEFVLENGVGQGRGMSAQLFARAISHSLRRVPLDVREMFFADDFSAYCSGKSVEQIHSRIQETLDRVAEWLHTLDLLFLL